MTDQSKYPKHVFWSDEDEGFIAIAPDLPGCSAFGKTEVAALTELESAIEAWIDAARTVGNETPAPSRPALRKEYSGKLLVRMPQSLHHELANAAKREDVSLNQFIVFVLSRYFGPTSVESRSVSNLTRLEYVKSKTISSGRYHFTSGLRAAESGIHAMLSRTAPVAAAGGTVMFVGTNCEAALTSPVGTSIASSVKRATSRCQSWDQSLSTGLAFYGSVQDEIASRIFTLNTSTSYQDKE